MHYLGGKYRTRKQISTLIHRINETAQHPVYFEPFIGAGWVASSLDKSQFAYFFGSDANHDLIILWQALQKGWNPPDIVSEYVYRELKNSAGASPLRSFAGFGCSFGGKWFGGYARGSEDRNYASNAKNSLLKKTAKINSFNLFTYDFCTNGVMPKKLKQYLQEGKCLIYCDPPYEGVTGYKNVTFDKSIFMSRCIELAKLGNTVLVSEYKIDDPNFIEVWSTESALDLHTNKKERKTVEKIFQVVANQPETTVG